MEFEFKKITTPENLERLAGLMDICFGVKVGGSFFKWKYFDNPAGQAIVYEAIYNGKTVGSYGIIPEFYRIDGVIKKTYQAVEAMTHPDFRRKGLFVKLAQLVLQDVQQEKELFMIAFPGTMSLEGFVNKLNWKLIQNCNYIFLPKILSNIKNRSKSANDSQIIKLDAMNETLDTYLETRQPHTKVSKVISKEIFNWKIFNNPRFKYNVVGLVNNNVLLGVCVYRVDYQNTCLINWLHFKDEADYKIYTSDFLKHIFEETKIRYVYTLKSNSHFLSEAYKKAGFITNPFKKGPFNSKVPFAVYQQGFGSSVVQFDNYDFQPIILD